jgi:hypothetical protein
VDASLAASGDQAGLPAACLDTATAMVPAWAAGSARAVDGAIVFEATSPAVADGASTAKDSASAVASRLPPTTVAAIEVRDFGTGLVSGIDALKKQLACDPSTAEAFDEIEQALASIGGAEALIGWADDTALALEYDDGAFGGGLAATVTDEAAADRTLGQLKVLLALGGASAGLEQREEAYGSGTLLVVGIPADLTGAEIPEIAATVQDGVFVLGTIDFVKHVIDTVAGSSLATSPAYQRAISAAGGDGVADVFVNIAALRAAAEEMIPAEERSSYDTEVRPFLEPFEAFASVSKSPGTTNVVRAVLTFGN